MHLWAKICCHLPRPVQPLIVTSQLCDSLVPTNICSLPHTHQLPCPSLLSSDLKIKYPCLWHNHLVLKLSSLEASVIISGLPARKQQEAGDRMPVAVIASVRPKAPDSAMQRQPEAAARDCCRMLTEGGKIHLQSELFPCFCFDCFLSHPFIPSALTPLKASGQAGCPAEGLSDGALSHPSEGVAARTVCSLPWGTPLIRTPRHDSLVTCGRDQLTSSHPSHLPPWDLQPSQDKTATG